jgi:hypothetical protein
MQYFFSSFWVSLYFLGMVVSDGFWQIFFAIIFPPVSWIFAIRWFVAC